MHIRITSRKEQLLHKKWWRGKERTVIHRSLTRTQEYEEAAEGINTDELLFTRTERKKNCTNYIVINTSK